MNELDKKKLEKSKLVFGYSVLFLVILLVLGAGFVVLMINGFIHGVVTSG
ncbi:MAG: hypothetical protein V4474_00075 [Patescibacteria group bacterium]